MVEDLRLERVDEMSRLRTAFVAVALVASVLLPGASALASPNPTSVTIAGSLQSELGCPGDWEPDCAATHLAYDAADDVWQGDVLRPAGGWEYKAALNDCVGRELRRARRSRTAPTSR